MTHIDRAPGEHRFRDASIATAKLVAVVAALAMLTHISWNLFAPDMFGLPEIRMKQALGLVTFAGVAGLLVRHPFGRRHNA